jgi:sulfur-carrier protein
VNQLGVTVELFGVARHRAGAAELSADGRTIADLLRSVERLCPALNDLFASDGSLSRRYLISFDGERFVSDLADEIPPGSRVLILGADAGG